MLSPFADFTALVVPTEPPCDEEPGCAHAGAHVWCLDCGKCQRAASEDGGCACLDHHPSGCGCPRCEEMQARISVEGGEG